jgi:hypothetical protein
MSRALFHSLCALVVLISVTATFRQAGAEPRGDYFLSDPPEYYPPPRYYPPQSYYAPQTFYAPPPVRYYPRYEYARPPAAYYAPPIADWTPPRPRSCGKYKYWDGEYCADARYQPPYVGPRW